MKEIVDFIGIGIAGILGLLWFDLRNIRKTFITLSDHEKLLKIHKLEEEKGFKEYIDEKMDELKDLIKSRNSE